MATISGSLIHKGTEILDFDLRIQFSIPTISYSRNSSGLELASSTLASTIVKGFFASNNKKYKLKAAQKKLLISKDDSLLLMNYLTNSLFKNVSFSSIDFSLFDTKGIYSSLSTTSGDLLEQEKSHGALFFFNLDSMDIYDIDHKDDFRSRLFFVNKENFYSRLEKAKELTSHDLQDDVFLKIFLLMVNTKTDIPTFVGKRAFNKYRNILKRKLESHGVDNTDDVFALIESNFDEYFDFSIDVPHMLNVAGTFSIDGDDIQASDFEAYTVIAEYYSTDPSHDTQQLNQLNYDWNNSNITPPAKSTDISFIEDHAISQDLIPNEIWLDEKKIKNTINIKVKSFDGVTLWEEKYLSDAPELSNLDIKVPLYRPNVSLDNDKDNLPSSSTKKIRGQVVSLNKKYISKGLTVIIQAKKKEDDIWSVVSAGDTNQAGHFTLPYAEGKYLKAQALVSIAPDSPVDIDIVIKDGQEQGLLSDEFIYILLDEAEVVLPEEDEKDKTKKDISRIPDHEDLIGSSEYSQDIGGTCLNLTTPNRTLREYNYQAIVRTSDPDVANYTLEKINDKYELTGGIQTITRGNVNLNNPILWQDSPDSKENSSFYQAVTVATGHILHYKSAFKADGYSLGDLLYSLPLAPGQKKQIVVFDSSHELRGEEQQYRSQAEDFGSEFSDDRTITDKLGGSLNESLQGKSSASTWGVSAGLGVAGSYAGISGVLGISGGYASSNSSASQNSSKNTSQFFEEKLRRNISQSAESYREQNLSTVSTVKQNQNYSVETEVVANHNHCHSMTMMYFEVLRHYAIYQELSHVEECIFVPLLLTDFSTENIHKWKDVLATHLLPIPSNTYLGYSTTIGIAGGYRQHPLLKAFDANERIKTDYTRVDFPPKSKTYADGDMTRITGSFVMNVNIPRPKTKYDRIKSFPLVIKTSTHEEFDLEKTIKKNVLAAIGGPIGIALFGGNATRTVEEKRIAVEEVFDSFMTLDANYKQVPPRDCIRITNFKPRTYFLWGVPSEISGENFFDGGHLDRKAWETYAKILGYEGNDAVYELLNYYFKDKLISEWDEIFYKELLPLIFAKIVDSIRIDKGTVKIKKDVHGVETITHSSRGFNLDVSTASKYTGGNRKIRVNFKVDDLGIKRSSLPDYLSISPDNDEILILKNHIKLNIGRVRMSYETKHFTGTLFNGYVRDDLLDGTNLFIPLTSRDKINPRKEDEYIANQLMEHLNVNLEHYNKVLWMALDPDRRYMLLDGFGIEVFDADNHKIPGKRSLASIVKNELITVAGNSLVFPVADGYRVSESFVTVRDNNEKETNISLHEQYKPLTPPQPYRISVPTRGVFMEAIMGECNACEKVQKETSQDWNKFKTDEPTGINSVTVPTPEVQTWQAVFKEFAKPLVGFQNVPAMPSPGAGLAGVGDLLGKSGTFKDITGLQGNQDNVMKTYLSNQENAKAFAQMAKDLALHESNTTNSDGITNKLRDAKNSGAISEKEFKDLSKDHLENLIGKKEDNKAKQGEYTDTVEKAVRSNKPVKVQKTDSKGNTESAEIGKSEGSENSKVKIHHNVSPLKQGKNSSCWAAASTMLMNWKLKENYTEQDTLELAGKNIGDNDYYINIYNNDNGLMSNEKEKFISSLKMVTEAPASYSLETYVDLLETYGPLWVTLDADLGKGFSPHAVILFGISGDPTSDQNKVVFSFINPSNGQQFNKTFEEFIVYYEQMVTDNASGALFVQIVRFNSKINYGEGRSNNGLFLHDYLNSLPELISNGEEKIIREDGYAYKLINFKHKNGITLPGFKKRKSKREINFIILHWGGSSAKTTASDLKARGLSTHFGIDGSEIYQYVDVNNIAWHAGYINGLAIGIDFSQSVEKRHYKSTLKRWPDVEIIDNPETRGDDKIVTLNSAAVYSGRKFVEDLCKEFDIPFEFPRGITGLEKTGDFYHGVMKKDDLENKKFRGILGHHHIKGTKWDIAPWWDQLFGDLE